MGAPLFSLESDLELGIDSGEPEWHIFGQRIMFEVGPRGRMYIFNVPHQQGGLVVSPAGELLRRILPPGSGPGEGRGPANAFWIDGGKEQWIWDRNLHRIDRLDPDGTFIDSISLLHRADEWMGIMQLVDREFIGYRRARDPEGLKNRMNEYGLLTDDFAWDQTIIRMAPSRISPKSYSVGPITYGLPFAATHFFVTYPSGLMAFGDTDSGIITQLSQDGDPLRRFGTGRGPDPITDEDRRRFLRYIETRHPEDLPAARRAKLPDRWGCFFYAIADTEDRLWVRRGKPAYGQDEEVGYHYDVFDREGRWLGSQVLPVPTWELEIKDGYMYIAINSLDRGPRLQRYRMIPLFAELGP